MRPLVHKRRYGPAVLAALLLGGCAQAPQAPVESSAAPALPLAEYRSGARPGDKLYRIDSEVSRIFLRTGRAGPMKDMGHDHVIASEHVEGIVLLAADPARSRAHLRIPLQRLVVDKPAYRSRFGLEPQLPADSIDGTTSNMQERVLDSTAWPWATVTARYASAVDEPPTLAVSISLHGSSFEYLVPGDIGAAGDVLRASGKMIINHQEFGLEPFSAAGGLLRVAEEIGVEFEFVGTRM